MRPRDPITELAHESAKAYFKAKNLPHWTHQYQAEYPVYVRSFVSAYKREEKRKARLAEKSPL